MKNYYVTWTDKKWSTHTETVPAENMADARYGFENDLRVVSIDRVTLVTVRKGQMKGTK